ncbi:HlyD family secretion protein [Vibrio nitrifigilis]|uniref:HlyD family efflux transporter periplasmic adaptor subunit n=1 Tax=Vibrio nitrifigilis TaxID=2789781 RepID=A0ABS0GJ91_9VIBR|nr:HlyD family efflux transporter periplasmic adaptor subunit [Vibrio nitrifigilis]MBF9002501.1 HlyD family efflux transporter periplasmic adaptor subunit [Vibrio nitrifigilis]
MRNGFICALLTLILAGCSPQEKPQALGTLERDRVSLTATASEVIQSIPVKEGQPIHQGDVLVQLSPISQQAVVEKAKAEQLQAQVSLNKLLNGERIEDVESAKADVDNAKVHMENAEKHYQRIAALVARKLSSQSEKDNAQADRDEARASYTAAVQNLKKLSSGYRTEDIEVAKAKLSAATAELKLQQHRLEELTIKATRDGVLDSLPYNQGERVATNAVLAIIEAGATPYARVYMPEPFVASYPIGSQVTVHIDGADKAVTGTIHWMSKEPAFTSYKSMSASDRSRLVYLTKISLPDSSASLPAGIPVQVDLDKAHD